MNLGSVSKALAGAAAGAAAGVGTTVITVPDGTPWYGYIVVGVINAAIGFAVVYFAPANKAS